jgi:hypothetical protein
MFHRLTYDDREWHMVGGTHLAGGSDNNGADGKSEEDNGNGLTGSES